MPEYKKAHLTQANREVIEDGLRGRLSASRIAAKINVSKSTVTREVKANRTCKLPDRRNLRHASLCVHYDDCLRVCNVCGKCNMRDRRCRFCRTKDRASECADFEPIQCEFTVHHVMVNGKPLELDASYSVGGSSFILKEGGDGYSMFKKRHHSRQ